MKVVINRSTVREGGLAPPEARCTLEVSKSQGHTRSVILEPHSNDLWSDQDRPEGQCTLSMSMTMIIRNRCRPCGVHDEGVFSRLSDVPRHRHIAGDRRRLSLNVLSEARVRPH